MSGVEQVGAEGRAPSQRLRSVYKEAWAVAAVAGRGGEGYGVGSIGGHPLDRHAGRLFAWNGGRSLRRRHRRWCVTALGIGPGLGFGEQVLWAGTAARATSRWY